MIASEYRNKLDFIIVAWNLCGKTNAPYQVASECYKKEAVIQLSPSAGVQYFTTSISNFDLIDCSI